MQNASGLHKITQRISRDFRNAGSGQFLEACVAGLNYSLSRTKLPVISLNCALKMQL